MRSNRFAVWSCWCFAGLAAPLAAQQQDTAKRTRTITVTERAGVAWARTPVEVTVRFERDVLKDPNNVRLFHRDGKGLVPVARQVLEAIPQAATDSFAPTPQTFVRIAFPVSLRANRTETYVVNLDGPGPPAPGEELKIAGADTGAAIDTGTARFELHKSSGQLLSFTPGAVGGERQVFLQHKERGELPFHWNPDIWPTGRTWGHTSDWNAPTAFDPARHKAESPPPGSDKTHPYFYRQWKGPILHRLTRWGRMPFAPEADVSVTYTFHAGSSVVGVQSLIEFREGLALHTVRNAELVFSRHQFDTAVWLTKDGKLHTAPAYDYNDKDKSFKDIARLPPDVPCLGMVNERKGYGIALVVLSQTNLNKRTGHAADEQAHFYLRDYDEHGRGSPANFLYFARPLVYRAGYLPTTVAAGSVYAERSAMVVFLLKPDPARRYQELLDWQKALTSPLEITVD
jgi:hypothetical protein